LLLLAASASAAPLTMDEAVRRALGRPELAEMVDGAAAAATAEAEASGLWENPELAYEHEQLFGSGAPEQAVVLSQRFDLGGVRSRSARAGRRRVEIARAEGAARRIEVTAEVRRRFSAVQYHQHRHAVLAGWASRLDGALAVIGRRERAGDASAYDRKRVERELRVARLEVDAETGEREAAWARLDALVALGRAPAAWPRVVGEDLPPASARGGPEGRPDLRVIELSASVASLEALAAERRWVPELVASAGWRGAAREHGFVAGLALDLPVFDDGAAEVARARAAQIQATARHTLALSEARAEVGAIAARAARTTDLARRFRGESASAADDLVRTAEVAYAGGELGLLELLDAYRGATDDTLRAFELDRRARDTATALWAATNERTER